MLNKGREQCHTEDVEEEEEEDSLNQSLYLFPLGWINSSPNQERPFPPYQLNQQKWKP